MNYIRTNQSRNELSNINIEFFEIKGLFGRYNVKLNLNKKVNIYVSENGFGKTTILNCIYYVLTKKYDKLEKIEFDTINIKFKNNNYVNSISKNDVIKFNMKKSKRRSIYSDQIYNEFLQDFFDNFRNERNHLDSVVIDEKVQYGIKMLSKIYGIPLFIARDMVFNYLIDGKLPLKNKERGNEKMVEKLNEDLDNNLKQKIMYFTTYRRIEDDLSNIIRNTIDYSDTDLLIKFGMSDVEKNIESILNTIKEKSRENFNKMTGILLEQYLANEMKRSKKVNEGTVEIVLDRLSNQIDSEKKEKILTLVKSNEIYDPQYKHLLNLLNKLLDNYESQLIYDKKINKFVETCNRYLHRKKFVYDQSNLKLYVKMESSNSGKNDTLELSKLSSGEKQIVSLFSKLYLEKDDESIILIDEPELSISIQWQRMLLPDIIKSGNCKLLVTVTHSPFIFDNEFEYDAKEIRYSTDNYERR